MRTPRVFIPHSVFPGETVRLPDAEGRHLARVLRRGPGDAVQLLTQEGRAFEGRISAVEPNGQVVVAVVEEIAGDALMDSSASRAGITLGVAVVKGAAFELAVRMAAELGIVAVVPLFSARTVVRWDGSSGKRRRYERIAQEAAKQCGRVVPLRLEEPADFSAWIETAGRDVDGASRWIAVPGAPLPRRPEPSGPGRAEAVFAVGPEGGFTDAEVRAAVSAGWQTCGFPTPVLRTPTAVALIAAVGLLWDP